MRAARILKPSVAGAVLLCVVVGCVEQRAGTSGKEKLDAGFVSSFVSNGTDTGSSATDAGSLPTAFADAGTPEGVVPCAAPPEVDNSPESVLEAVALVNALPRPVTVACFLEALARPIALHASQSIFSAQPAAGARSPRMFLFYDPLILSVVPDGVGSDLVEFGEQKPGQRSLKAEIKFPVTELLPEAAAFERLMFSDTLTSCAFCHEAEQPSTEVTFTPAFVSEALKPLPAERVSLEALRLEAESCDRSAEPTRCAILAGIFAQGNVVEREFPAEMNTFF